MPDLVEGYVLQHRLGRGGFAEVYAAIRSADRLEVAIKIGMDLGASAAISREVEVLATVGGKTVPELLGAGTVRGRRPYLVMERLSGKTLADVLDTATEPLSPMEAVETVLEIASAVGRLHVAGWAHLDLKPENIFLTRDGVRLVDLGLSQPVLASPATVVMGAGTPEYMAPEQCVDDGHLDVRTDVYALGVILFELLTERPPFVGAPGAVQGAHVEARPPPMARFVAVDTDLEAVVARALAKDPARRFPDAAAFADALAAARPSDLRSERATTMPSLAAARSTRLVALADIVRTAPAGEVIAAAATFGGRIGHWSGSRLVLAFDAEVAEKPVDRAMVTARRLLERGLIRHAVVDVATVHDRELGGIRFAVGWGLDRPDRGAEARDGEVVLTPAAAACAPQDGSRDDSPRATGAPVAEPPPLVGRTEVLDRMVGIAREALAARLPCALTVLAESGLGKSRLADELVARLAGDTRAVVVRATHPIDGDGAHVLAPLLGRALGLPALGTPSVSAPDRGRLLLASRLGGEDHLWTGLAAALRWLPAGAPELAAVRAAPGALHHQIVLASRTALVEAARHAPLCLVIDDFHLTDATTLDVLEAVADPAHGVPLVVIGLARPELVAARPTWKLAPSHTFRLGPLPRGDALALARALLGTTAEATQAAVLDRIVERAGSSPAVLVEIVRAWRRDGTVNAPARLDDRSLTSSDDVRAGDAPLLAWLAERELAAMPPGLAAYARLFAVLGDNVGQAELEAIVRDLDGTAWRGELALDPGVATRRLVELGVLAPSGGDRLGFRLQALRDAVYDGTPDTPRRTAHVAAYHYLARPDRETAPGRLAHHAEAAGLRDVAARLYLALASDAERRHDYHEAARAASRALGLADSDERRLEVLALRGRVCNRAGLHGDARADLEAAAALAARVRPPAELSIRLDLAALLDWYGELSTAARQVDRAGYLADHYSPPETVLAALLLARARVAHRAGDLFAALSLNFAAADLAEQIGDDAYETYLRASLALPRLALSHGRTDEAMALVERARVAAESRGDIGGLAMLLDEVAQVHIVGGDLDEARSTILRARALAAAAGALHVLCSTAVSLAELAYATGDADATRQWAGLALEQSRGRLPALEVQIPLLLARTACAAGALGEARHWWHQAQTASAPFGGWPSPESADHAAMIELALSSASDDAWEHFFTSAAMLGPAARVEALDLEGLTALRAGRIKRARSRFEKALRLAQQRARLWVPRMLNRLYGIEGTIRDVRG